MLVTTPLRSDGLSSFDHLHSIEKHVWPLGMKTSWGGNEGRIKFYWRYFLDKKGYSALSIPTWLFWNSSRQTAHTSESLLSCSTFAIAKQDESLSLLLNFLIFSLAMAWSYFKYFSLFSRFISPFVQIQPLQRNAVIKKRLKLFFLPSAFTLLVDGNGDEEDDSIELTASIS